MPGANQPVSVDLPADAAAGFFHLRVWLEWSNRSGVPKIPTAIAADVVGLPLAEQ